MKNQTFTLEATIARMKAEILQHIAEDMIPASVTTFSELHDYFDANCFGGFCEDEVYNALIAQLGIDGALYFINDAQNAVHEWLRAGRPA